MEPIIAKRNVEKVIYFYVLYGFILETKNMYSKSLLNIIYRFCNIK